MFKRARTILSLIIIAAMLSSIGVSLILETLEASANDGNRVEGNLSLPDEWSDKINSKLDFNVKRLIYARELGIAEEFAERICVELINDSVTVTIECKSDQAEAVAEAAGALGNVELSVHYLDLVQVVVPITNLTALADIPGVILVRLPIAPEED
jgi:hypothetical protein